MNVKEKAISTKLLVFLFVLVNVAEMKGAPVSTNRASLVSCPPPSGKCYWEPEETCTSHSDCQWLSASKWIGLCCPHICEGKKVCRDFRVPKPPTTIRPTTEGITTTEYTSQPNAKSSTTDITTPLTTRSTTKGITTTEDATQPSTKSSTITKSSTTDITKLTVPTTNPVTTKTNEFTTTSASTSKPSTASSTEKYFSTQKPSTNKFQTTTEKKISTIELPTTEAETTTKEAPTERPTTTRAPITTLATTVLPSSSPAPTKTMASTPKTQEPRPGPSICSKADSKDILFIIDGTANYQQYWLTKKNEWNQVKQFVKELVLELNSADNFRIGVMQYGGRREPEMEVDLWESADTADLMYHIDNMRQFGRTKRMTGEALVMATNKFYELNSVYERGSAQDIIVLITRGRPSDREQTVAEVEMLKRKMVRIISIGVGPHSGYLKKSLRDIASFTQDAIVSKYSEIANKKKNVLEKICWPVTLPATESLCQNKRYDIYFVHDGSRSIRPSDFDKKRKFLKDVFFLMDSPSSELHTGMMQFSTVENTETILRLQKHSLNEELESIENMQYHSGRRTMLGDALSQINDKVFNGNNGDRSAVENVLVIFSDGRAHDITTAFREANNMKERNVRIIAMTVSEYGDVPDNLRKLATFAKYAISIKLSSRVYTVQSAKKLVSMICKANN